MTKSWNPKRSRKRYDRAGAVVLNRVRLGQAPISLQRVRWRHRGLWMLLGLVVIGGALALWLTVDARFYVYDARIVGNNRLSPEEIFEASGLRGLHVLWARSSAIEPRILEAFPSLESVRVSCGFPSDCTISVTERRPRILWRDNEERWWIDGEGAIFLAREDGGSVETGIDSDPDSGASGQWAVVGPLPQDEEGNLDAAVQVALTELWESGRDLPGEFQYSPAQGLSFVDQRGWRVIVGEGAGMAARLEVLEGLVIHLESRGVTPRFLDVRFPETPYYLPATE